MYYSNVYSGAIYYGNNDYRDYIAHSKGPWKKHLYKFIDAAGNYVYDTAKKVGGAISNATGYTAKSKMNYHESNALKGYASAKQFDNMGQRKTADTFRKGANENAKKAAEYERQYNKSFAGAVDRTITKVKSTRTYTTAKRLVRSAASSMRTAFNTVKTKAADLIDKGKRAVNRFISGLPIVRKYRANKALKAVNEQQAKATAKTKEKQKAAAIEKSNRIKTNKARVEWGNDTKRNRLKRRGIAPSGAGFRIRERYNSI